MFGKLIGKSPKCLDENLKTRIIENNFNVDGVELITNAKKENDELVITTGRFVFNLKGENDGK